jgi:hypothetical protein
MTALTELEKLNSHPSEKTPPEHLYHYTSIDGLEGILTKRSLWASQIHFLNDTQEFKYAVHILKEVLSGLREEYPITWSRVALGPCPPPSEPKEFLAEFYRSLESEVLFDLFKKFPICIFSLSERGDLLSQWRGYCPPGGGYSIGFPSKLLIQFLKTRDLCLKPCVYDEKEQQAIVKRTITEKGQTVLKRLSGPPIEIQDVFKKCFVEFFMEFSQIASILKHPSFYEECEWRIVSSLIENRYMSFRVRKSMLIPFFSISFEGIEPVPIDEIIVGPAPEQGLAESSLFQFVLRSKLNISIKSSKTPYREL